MSLNKVDSKYVNKYTLIVGVYGLAASFIQNGILRRPYLSGIHRHALFTLVGSVIGTYMGNLEKERFAQRDFYIEEYIQRNPDDFQKPPPKKVGEQYDIWMPVTGRST